MGLAVLFVDHKHLNIFALFPSAIMFQAQGLSTVLANQGAPVNPEGTNLLGVWNVSILLPQSMAQAMHTMFPIKICWELAEPAT